MDLFADYGLQGSSPPPKPWEVAGNSGGPTPFLPSSPGRTSEIVEASDKGKKKEDFSRDLKNATTNSNTLARPLPPRPWDQNYRGYAPLYNSGYNSGYNGGYGGPYGGLVGNGVYNGGYGGYGGSYGGGIGMYNSGYGPAVGCYGLGAPYGNHDPNNSSGPPQAPGFWASLLRVLKGIVDVFGGIAVLVDQNTQALHLFMSAFLQLSDRSGMLYGELARFVFRILGSRKKSKINRQPEQPNQLTGNPNVNGQQHYLQGPNNNAGGSSWDHVWGGSA